MNKKEYVIKVLDMLKNSFPLALGLKYFVENADVDNRFLDTMIDVIQKSMDGIADGLEKQKLERSMNFLQQLKQQELSEKEMDQKDIDKLDELLSNI